MVVPIVVIAGSLWSEQTVAARSTGPKHPRRAPAPGISKFVGCWRAAPAIPQSAIVWPDGTGRINFLDLSKRGRAYFAFGPLHRDSSGRLVATITVVAHNHVAAPGDVLTFKLSPRYGHSFYAEYPGPRHATTPIFHYRSRPPQRVHAGRCQ